MRTNQEFWDDVVIACIGATQGLPHVMADILLAQRQKRVQEQMEEESRDAVAMLAESKRTP